MAQSGSRKHWRRHNVRQDDRGDVIGRELEAYQRQRVQRPQGGSGKNDGRSRCPFTELHGTTAAKQGHRERGCPHRHVHGEHPAEIEWAGGGVEPDRRREHHHGDHGDKYQGGPHGAEHHNRAAGRRIGAERQGDENTGNGCEGDGGQPHRRPDNSRQHGADCRPERGGDTSARDGYTERVTTGVGAQRAVEHEEGRDDAEHRECSPHGHHSVIPPVCLCMRPYCVSEASSTQNKGVPSDWTTPLHTELLCFELLCFRLCWWY
jgi:hypothetical protein